MDKLMGYAGNAFPEFNKYLLSVIRQAGRLREPSQSGPRGPSKSRACENSTFSLPAVNSDGRVTSRPHQTPASQRQQPWWDQHKEPAQSLEGTAHGLPSGYRP